MSNILDTIRLSGVVYTLSATTSGGTVSSAITSGDTNAVAGGAVYDKFDEVEQVTARALNDLDENIKDKQDALTAGRGIDIDSGNTISFNLPISAGTGTNSIKEGSFTYANGSYSHAEGLATKASGDCSHAEGSSTSATNGSSHAEGSGTLASGDHSHAEGESTSATSNSSHAEGSGTLASGSYSHAEGYVTLASGDYGSHAEGGSTLASGDCSHAEGSSTSATNDSSHAEGSGTLASGSYSHAEGHSTSATSNSSHAEGSGTLASGGHSHAEGYVTLASGNYGSHAEGYRTSATSDASHAEGLATLTKNFAEHASGRYNNSVTASTTFGHSGNTLFSVGNGTANNARHNAFEIRQNGDIYLTSGNTDIKLQDHLGGGGNPTVELTQAEYDALVSAGTVASNTYYIITDATAFDPSTKVDTSAFTAYSAATNTALNNKVDKSAVVSAVTSTSTDNEIPTAKAVWEAASGGGTTYTAGRGIDITNDTISFSLPISSSTETLLLTDSSNSISDTNSVVVIGTSNNISSNISSRPTLKSIILGFSNNITSSNFSENLREKNYIIGNNNSIKGGGNVVIGTNNIGYNSATNAAKNSYIVGNSNSLNYGSATDKDNNYIFGSNNKVSNSNEVSIGYYNNSVSDGTTSGNTFFSIGNGTADNARHNAFEIRQNGDIYLSSGGTDIKLQDHLGSTPSSAITSGDTNAVAGGAVYAKLDEMEEVISRALNDLNARITAIENQLNSN